MKLLLLLFILSIYSLVQAKECDLKSPINSYHPEFAKHFYIDYFKNFKVIHVDDEQYFLSQKAAIDCDPPFFKIQTPVKKVVMMSSTYLAGLELLDEEKTLMAFQGKQYIVSLKFDLNKILGVSFKFNVEELLSLKADLIMGYDSNFISFKQQQIFNTLKIPVVKNKDYQEKTPLGRAEWLVYISSFYDLDARGIKKFQEIKKKYYKF